MGVPSFYRWLVRKYPSVVVRALEDNTDDDDSDTTSPNPNGEFDNLYLDMNGIIHPCFHPDDHACTPTTFAGVFQCIFQYIDRLFNIVRPRKLLYMAIDGVAPRAKMNQQRSRRFRTAKDNETAEAEEKRLKTEFEKEGKHVLPNVESEVTDSNIITPGTNFMYELSKALQGYAFERLRNDAGWKSIKVILSDANVPGEGEHKIMSFIRLQRTCPGYNPNTRHCLYGLDADLLMLALATHEVHFSILREDVIIQDQEVSCQSVLNTTLQAVESNSQNSRGSSAFSSKKPYEFLNIWILREYLQLDMDICNLPESLKDVDFERVIDDFIFFCFFAGNDFLPHMPTLEIHEGAIDLLMTVYKTGFKTLGGYLVDMQRVNGNKGDYINLKRVEKFVLLVGAFEEKIFKKRSELLERKLKRILSEYAEARRDEEQRDEEQEEEGDNMEALASINAVTASIRNPQSSSESFTPHNYDVNLISSPEILAKNTKELKERLKETIRSKSDLFRDGGLALGNVRLGYFGWKERYYKYKFSAETHEDIESTRTSLVQSYTEGLCWVLLYYFSGVPSWTWFYPYHYGPFASDLKGLAQVRLTFQKGSPFKPFDQLMGVLPPRSAHALPKAYQSLMTDEGSKIIDFYPHDFEVDFDGKRYVWQGISKLPFIEENRLLPETAKLEKELDEDEAVRNAAGADMLFVRGSNDLGKIVLLSHKNKDCNKKNELIKINSCLCDGFGGYFDHLNDIRDDILCVFYKLPDDKPHIPRVLEGVTFPEKTITEADIEETLLWHDQQGSRPMTQLHQHSYRKVAKFNGLNSSGSSSGSIYKGCGTGWGHPIGRGQGSPVNSSVVQGRMMPHANNGRGRAPLNPSYPVERFRHDDNQKVWRSTNVSSRGSIRGRGQLESRSSFMEHNVHYRTPGYSGRGGLHLRPAHPLYCGDGVASSAARPVRPNSAVPYSGVSPQTSPQTRTWKAVVSSTQAEPTGIDNLTITDWSGHASMMHGRFQQGPTNDWRFGNNASNVWQQNQLATFSPTHGGGQYVPNTSTSNLSPRGNWQQHPMGVRGYARPQVPYAVHGRAQYVPRTSETNCRYGDSRSDFRRRNDH